MKSIFLLVYLAIPISSFRNTMMVRFFFFFPVKFIWLIYLNFCFQGEYRAVLESIDNRDELPRNMAEWHIVMERKNRKEKIVTGSFTLKKTIVKPWVCRKGKIIIIINIYKNFIPYLIAFIVKNIFLRLNLKHLYGPMGNL